MHYHDDIFYFSTPRFNCCLSYVSHFVKSVVIRCPELSDEGLVKVNCSHGYLRDSICRFSCSAAGYEVVGPDMTQCVMDRDEASWSSARPSCTGSLFQ